MRNCNFREEKYTPDYAIEDLLDWHDIQIRKIKNYNNYTFVSISTF